MNIKFRSFKVIFFVCTGFEQLNKFNSTRLKCIVLISNENYLWFLFRIDLSSKNTLEISSVKKIKKNLYFKVFYINKL